jgi:hypothetical protein
MSDLDSAMKEVHAAVGELIAAADRCSPIWTTPRAPGAWSPSQIVEHVARALDESAAISMGESTKFPTFPVFVRPLVRMVFFNRTLKSGAFPKAKTNPAMNPAQGPATPDEGRARLNIAAAKFDAASRALVAQGKPVSHPIFGQIDVGDHARFQALHTRHHCRQMPGSSA